MKYFWLFSWYLSSFATIWNEFFTIEDFLEHVRNEVFQLKLSSRLKIILKTSEMTSGRGLLLYIMVYQYIMGRALSCSVILNSNFLHYLMLVLVSSSFDFRVCEYVDVEFLFLFGET